MGDEETKNISQRGPSTHLDQVDSDYALAFGLQEQERAYTMLSRIDSNGDEEDDMATSDSDDENENDSQFFDSEIQDEQGRLEEEDSNSDQEMEEDDIDPDELSYEELIALGEIVGEEGRGLSTDEISSSLHSYKHQSITCKTHIDRCVICQLEYEDEETLVALPCDHPYHLDCISNWLQIKKVCPICGTEVSTSKTAKTT